MNDLNKDILVSGLFVVGLFGFVSGAYIVSSALLASITLVNGLRNEIESSKGLDKVSSA